MLLLLLLLLLIGPLMDVVVSNFNLLNNGSKIPFSINGIPSISVPRHKLDKVHAAFLTISGVFERPNKSIIGLIAPFTKS